MEASSYSAGDAIYDLGAVRAILTPRLDGDGIDVDPEESVFARMLLDRVQSWLAHPAGRPESDSLAAAIGVRRTMSPEWTIPVMRDGVVVARAKPPFEPRIEQTVDLDETSRALEEHLASIGVDVSFLVPPHDPSEPVGFEATIVSYGDLGPEARKGRLIFRPEPIDTCPPHLQQAEAVAQRMADELEHHMNEAGAQAVAAAEDLLRNEPS